MKILIRGKIPNAFKESKAKFLANQEIASIITIIGGGYGKNFDISKVKFDKIIFLADADPDGSHINTLLLRFFIMYMPELIQAGRVYRAVPPLFGIKAKGGTKYFTTKLDFTKYVQNLFAHTYTLTDVRGKRLNNNETTNLFFKNINYKDQMDFVANTFAIDPDLLETILYYISDYIEFDLYTDMVSNMAAAKAKPKAATKKKKEEAEVTSSTDEDAEIDMESIPITEGSVSSSIAYRFKDEFNVKDLKSKLKKLYRFIDVIVSNGVIRIEGLVNSKYQYIFINDKFVSTCVPLIKMIQNNMDLYYSINGENVSLYTLMSRFDEMIPSGLTRYKGLGEQNPEQLGVSALHPAGDRTLIQYTIESAKEEIETMRRLDSTMASLLRNTTITKADIE